MNKFTEVLSLELSHYYSNLAIKRGFVPKIFTFVTNDGDQYLFFLDSLGMDRSFETDFLNFIVKENDAVCYARGFLAITQDEQQHIEIFVIDRDDDCGIWCRADLDRNTNGVITGLSEFKRDVVIKKQLAFSWLSNEKFFSADEQTAFNALWTKIKPNAMYRKMNTAR